MLVMVEITSYTYFRLKFELETENMLKLYSFYPTKEGLGSLSFVAGPDGAGVSTNVGKAL